MDRRFDRNLYSMLFMIRRYPVSMLANGVSTSDAIPINQLRRERLRVSQHTVPPRPSFVDVHRAYRESHTFVCTCILRSTLYPSGRISVKQVNAGGWFVLLEKKCKDAAQPMVMGTLLALPGIGGPLGFLLFFEFDLGPSSLSTFFNMD